MSAGGSRRPTALSSADARSFSATLTSVQMSLRARQAIRPLVQPMTVAVIPATEGLTC